MKHRYMQIDFLKIYISHFQTRALQSINKFDVKVKSSPLQKWTEQASISVTTRTVWTIRRWTFFLSSLLFLLFMMFSFLTFILFFLFPFFFVWFLFFWLWPILFRCTWWGRSSKRKNIQVDMQLKKGNATRIMGGGGVGVISVFIQCHKSNLE